MGTLQLLTSTLEKYERVSGQNINKEKSALYLHKNVPNGTVVIVQVAARILRHDFPFNYLGCPVFYIIKRKDYYQSIINRISNKLQAWKV